MNYKNLVFKNNFPLFVYPLVGYLTLKSIKNKMFKNKLKKIARQYFFLIKTN